MTVTPVAAALASRGSVFRAMRAPSIAVRGVITKRAAMEAPRRGSRATGVVLVLVAAVLWSTGGLGIKSTPLPPLALAGYRGLFALPVLLGMVAVSGRHA